MVNDHSFGKVLLFSGFLVPCLILFSCKKGEPELVNGKNNTTKIVLISGDSQSGEFNTTLKDSLVVQVTDFRNKPVFHAPVQFETKNGIGSISPAFVWTDSTGFAYTRIQLACYLSEHLTIAYLCDENSNYIDSVSFRATPVKPAKWGRACGIVYAAEKIREQNNKYYTVSQSRLYVSNDGGVNWDLFPNLPYSSVSDLQFNSKGWMYLLTRNNGVYYSVNEGSTWIGINNGLVTSGSPLCFMVEDTVMYVSYLNNGLYRSRNNGQSWKKLFIFSTYLEENSFVTRHPTGKLFLFDRWDELFVSADNGDSWSYINLSYKFGISEVSAFAIGTNGLLYIGSGDATITIISPDTYTGEKHSYYKYNSTYQTVNNIIIKENIVYFTLSGSPVPGIYSSNGWKRIENGFYKGIQSLYLKADGKFLVGCNDYTGGLYYE